MKKTALYIHIPFCDHKCIYCDFYSLINYKDVEIYLSVLKQEISNYAKQFAEGRIIDTIFFGGGTPSFMTPQYISDIILTISSQFNLSENAEITLETNPGTVDQSKLKEYLEVGINRLSIGIQSFNNEELKFLTRIHNSEQAIQTVNDAAKVGFENISIDLIFSIPNQSINIWEDNLKTAVSLPIKHISAYSLILEKGTILNKMVLDGKVKMRSDNHDANLYKFTMDFLNKMNFNQYEVSNFAADNYACRHNLYYWQYNDYLSFGTAAHSFADGRRWWNYSSLTKYIKEIGNSGNAVRGEESLTSEQQLDEIIMLGLRSKGIDLGVVNSYSKEWYIEKQKKIDSFIKNNLIIRKDNLLSCTTEGYLICDELISKLI